MEHNLSRRLAILTILVLFVVSHRRAVVGAPVEQAIR